MLVSDVNYNSEQLSNLQMTTSSISASVSNVSKELSTLTNSVNAAITADELTVAVQNELASGVDKVTTSTGFTFNQDGLTITKTDSEMSTQITEDGMTVTKDNSEVLTANNEGVTAIDLHATTYLIVGSNSRFEDYTSGRTGCFWIG